MISWVLTLTLFLSLLLSLCLAHAGFAQQSTSASSASGSRESSLQQTAAAALNSLGVLYFERQELDKAMAAFQDALKYDPGNHNIRTNLAMIFYQRHQFEKVIETLGSTSGQLPNDDRTQAQYHVILADAHRGQLHVKEAIGEYEKALALAPTLPEVHYRLGVLYGDLHLYGQAREAFERELRISPRSADAAYSLG